MTDFRSIYNDVVAAANTSEVSAQEIGTAIVKIAQCFSEVVGERRLRKNVLAKKAVEILNSVGVDGKPMPVSKAEYLIEATPESQSYKQMDDELTIVERYMDALKAMQYGAAREFGAMGRA